MLSFKLHALHVYEWSNLLNTAWVMNHWVVLGNQISLWKEIFKKLVMIKTQMFQIVIHTMGYNRRKHNVYDKLRGVPSFNSCHSCKLNHQEFVEWHHSVLNNGLTNVRVKPG